MIVWHRFADFKEILLTTSIIIIDKETASVPVIICVIENFELYKGRLTRLDSRVILFPGAGVLLWYMFNLGKIFDRISLA